MTVADPANHALHWSLALLDGLIAAGVRLLVLSPGARSTPMVLAAQQRPQLNLVPIVDERSAAFFALGAAKVSRQPVALLATSGSAPAHWYPAVIEAAEWGVPLVLLSADRPAYERQLGTNQTIEQTRLFGVFVREFHEQGVPDGSAANLRAAYALGLRAATRAQQPRPGAVHLNLSFAEPLVPPMDSDVLAAAGWPVTNSAAPNAVIATAAVTIPTTLTLPAGRGVLLCGPGDYARGMEHLWAATARHGLPVLTDPLSGLRFGVATDGQLPATRIAGYDAIVRQPQYAQQLRPDWVIRLGRAPVSKRVTQWLADVPTVLVSADGSWHDPTHAVRWYWPLTPAALCQQLLAAPATAPDPAWLAQWQRAERQVAAMTADVLAQVEWCEAHIIAHLLATIPANEALLCANSLPIRQLETWSLALPNALLTVYGNRGVSGIDGQLATLAGMNHAQQPTWGLCGDLSFCHDLGGLLLARHWTRPLYVINNGGGRIFDYLPQQRLAGLETLWRMPQTIDFAQLACSFHLPYWRIDNCTALQSVPIHAAALIEIAIDAEYSARVHQMLWQRYENADVNSHN